MQEYTAKLWKRMCKLKAKKFESKGKACDRLEKKITRKSKGAEKMVQSSLEYVDAVCKRAGYAMKELAARECKRIEAGREFEIPSDLFAGIDFPSVTKCILFSQLYSNDLC